MKYFVKFLVVTFFFLQCTYASAEQKIVYLDMTFVLNKSKAGEGAQIFLKETFEENQKKFIIQENELKLDHEFYITNQIMNPVKQVLDLQMDVNETSKLNI